jgi:prepilin-type N-terminal cleavage/methylation domain-containing protein
MAQKYTILKVIIQNFSKINKTSKGFTLIELIVGLSIMVIVGGLAMNALIQASTSFNKDKRSIDSNQNMSTILEMIGNDIKQSGENINDANFPAIEFKIATEAGLKSGSSKVIIRRALITPLTLCEAITATQDLAILTAIKVADNLASTVNISANCDVATSSAPLSVYRVPVPVTPATTPATYYPTTYFPTITPTTDLPTTTPAILALKLPVALRKLRDYRCTLDNPNPTTAYDLPANAGTDFCDSVASEKTRIAISNESGQFLIFNQTGETAVTTTADDVAKAAADTTSTKTYNITVNNNFATVDPAIVSNGYNRVVYPIKSPIYVIEERIYTLTSDNNLQLSIDGKAPETLVKKIDNFRVSAKTYTNAKDRIIKETPTPAADICTDATPFADQPTTVGPDSPKYICKFNYFGSTTGTADWKTLAGIKVEIQTKYDGTGQNAIATAADTNKLYAASEFFPRNVLSK